MSNGLTIYSFGDADFMGSVLNAVAMLTNNGDIYRLAMIGAMVGLIMVGLRMIVTGGREFPFWHLLLGMVLAVCLLKPTTDVWVQPITPQPGSTYNTAQKVSNVPYLVALPGFFLSNIGYALTLDMEQAFSMPNGSGIASNGMATPMELMAAPAKLFQACQSLGALACSTAGAAVQTYLHDCAFPAAAKGELPMSQNLNTRTGMASVAVTDKWLTTTTLLPANGDASAPQAQPEAISCPDLYARLGKLFGDQALYGKLLDTTSTAQQAQKQTGVTATAAVAGAFSSYGFAIGQNLGDYYASLILASNWRAAKSSGPMAFAVSQGMDTAVEQASFQRMMQASGESNMFLRIMRPMIGFFESLIYALAPFMAFLLMLGPFGWKMITRYAMVTLWVEMWFPILAIVNLYGSWQLTHAANLTNAMIAAGTPLSAAGMISTTDTIVGLLTSTAMLVAATPAIALSIVYGTSITATYLAGKLGGGDHINEKIPAPDTMKEMPVSQNAAMFTGDMVSGSQMSGIHRIASSMSVNRSRAEALKSSYQEKESTSATFMESFGKQFQDAGSWNNAISNANIDQIADQNTNAWNEASKVLHSHGVDVSDNRSIAREVGNTLERLWNTSGKTSLDMNMGGSAGKGGPSVGGSGSYSTSETKQTGAKDSKTSTTAGSLATSDRSSDSAAYSRDEIATLQKVAGLTVQGISMTQSGRSMGITTTTGLGKSASDMVQADRAFAAAESMSKTAGEGQSIDVVDMSRQITDRLRASGGLDGFFAEHDTLMGANALARTQNSADLSAIGIVDHDQQHVAAIILGMSGNGAGAGLMPRDQEHARDEAYASMLGTYTDMGGAGRTAIGTDALRNSHIADGLQSPGTVEQHVRAAHADVGSSTTSAGLAGAQAHNEDVHAATHMQRTLTQQDYRDGMTHSPNAGQPIPSVKADADNAMSKAGSEKHVRGARDAITKQADANAEAGAAAAMDRTGIWPGSTLSGG